MDPLEWLARLSDHISDPGQHRTLFYGEYSNRVRASGHLAEPETQAEAKPEPRDPLVCVHCGQRMILIAFVTDQMAIGKILDHLGLSSPEAEKPPPPMPQILRVAEHARTARRAGDTRSDTRTPTTPWATLTCPMTSVPTSSAAALRPRGHRQLRRGSRGFINVAIDEAHRAVQELLQVHGLK